MSRQGFQSVWDAIEDSADQAENMKLRSSLMIALAQTIERHQWNQEQAASALGVTQPRISDLVRGKITLFSLDMLVNMAAAAGLQLELHISEPA